MGAEDAGAQRSRWWVAGSAVPLSVFWLLLSGHYTPLLLLLGAGSVALVLWLSYRANLKDFRGSVTGEILRLPPYVLWLSKEVLVAAIDVVRRVWSPRLDLRPQMEATDASGLDTLQQVTYANSITLTPGTLSMRVMEDHIVVHALDASGLEDLDDGRMLDRVRRLQAPTPDGAPSDDAPPEEEQ